MSAATRHSLENALRTHAEDEGWLPDDELLSDWVVVAYTAPVDPELEDGYIVDSSNPNTPAHMLVGLLRVGLSRVEGNHWADED